VRGIDRWLLVNGCWLLVIINVTMYRFEAIHLLRANFGHLSNPFSCGGAPEPPVIILQIGNRYAVGCAE
jgi:hypothetical protein